MADGFEAREVGLTSRGAKVGYKQVSEQYACGLKQRETTYRSYFS